MTQRRPGPRRGSRRPPPPGRGSGKSTDARRGPGGEQVEGRQAVTELLAAGRRPVFDVWLASERERKTAPVVDRITELAEGRGVPVRRVSAARLEAEARTEAPQGVLAHAAPLPDVDLDDLCRPRPASPTAPAGPATASRAASPPGPAGPATASRAASPPGPAGPATAFRAASPPGPAGPPFLLALDGVTDPQNLGALLRTAEGAGVTGAVVPRHRAAHVTPAVTKAAAGAVEHVPIAVVSGLPAALSRARDLGLWVVGLDPGADQSLFDLTLADQGVVVVLGAEGRGLSRLVRDRCDLVLDIPLKGRLPSLNVAAAGALALFEISRRR